MKPGNLIYTAEFTDTYGGEANYSWVRRATFEAPADISTRALMQRAKKEIGITGTRGRRETWGEIEVFYPAGTCTVLFIEYNDYLTSEATR